MKGTVYGIGLGPGDPELVSIKAYNLIKKNRDIFFFRKKNSIGKVSQIARKFYHKKTVEHVMEFPVTTEISFSSKEYKTLLSGFYDECCQKIKLITSDKNNAIVLCEGDPFFYGSFMHLYERLKDTEEIKEGNVLGSLKEDDVMSRSVYPFNRIVVNPHGFVVACTADFHKQLEIGDTTKNSLKEIWHGSQYQYLRKKHLNNHLDGLFCNKCINNIECKTTSLSEAFKQKL